MVKSLPLLYPTAGSFSSIKHQTPPQLFLFFFCVRHIIGSLLLGFSFNWKFIFDSQLDIFQCNNCQLECVTFYICIFNLQTLINSLAILIVNTCIQQIFFLNGYAVHWGLFRDLKTPHLKATLHDLKRLMQNCDFGDWRRF